MVHTQIFSIILPGLCKLNLLWIGPYQVLENNRPNPYKLELLQTFLKLHSIFNVLWQKAYTRTLVEALGLTELGDGPNFKVQAIHGHWFICCGKNIIEYLVVFVGYDISYTEFLQPGNLTYSDHLLRIYKRHHRLF